MWWHFLLAATGLTDASEQHQEALHRAQACVGAIPLSQLLLCSDSPWKTPQNLSDPYLRTLRNEPSNIPSIAVAISEALNLDVKELSATIRRNTMTVFGLSAEESGPDTPAATTTAMADTGAAGVAVAAAAAHAGKKSHKSASQTAKAPTSKAYYSCVRCRSKLFLAVDQKTHSMSTTNKTVFRVGEEGLCASTLMFRPAAAESSHGSGGDASGGGGGGGGGASSGALAKAVSMRGANVECAECGSKLGKFSSTEATCGCGAVVEGKLW